MNLISYPCPLTFSFPLSAAARFYLLLESFLAIFTQFPVVFMLTLSTSLYQNSHAILLFFPGLFFFLLNVFIIAAYDIISWRSNEFCFFNYHSQIQSMTQTRSEEDQLLDDYLKLKPSRAIDRLLSEHSIQKAFQFHNLLQERIKRNTTQLRSTLTNKYQHLIDCSTLLNSIKLFTDQIAQIESKISQVYRGPISTQQFEREAKRSLVSRIEEMIYKKQFSQAMKTSYSQSPQTKNVDYLPYLRIQILQALESQLLAKKFTKTFIQQLISCLQTYIVSLSELQEKQLIKNERVEGEILSILADTLASKGRANIKDNDVIQIIFKCKLLSLHRNKQSGKEEQNIYKFFHDIYSLINQKQGDGDELQHLAGIFCRNLSQIEHHLNETFITGGGAQSLSFRFDIYEKLLSSQEFIQILDQLYAIIVQNYDKAPKTTLRDNFINLWQNYYVELMGALFDKCNPVNRLPNHQCKEQNLPKQIQRYCIKQQSIDHYLNVYAEDLYTFTVNIKELFTKSKHLHSSNIDSQNILKEISEIYEDKINKLNTEIDEHCQVLQDQPNENSLRNMLLLFMLCSKFNRTIQKTAQENPMELIKDYQLVWKEKYVRTFNQVFLGKKYAWNVEFDKFFMEHYSISCDLQNKEILQKVVVLLIEGMLLRSDKERAQKYLGELQAEKVERHRKQTQNKNRLKDMPVDKVSASTFSKKKPTVPTNS